MCPDENTLAGYVQGVLSVDQRRMVETHIDTCPHCAELMSELGRVAGALMSPTLPEHEVERESKPPQIGRYVIEGMIGRGGMGEVLLAHDPVLHRRVAIKLIRAELLSTGEIEEAQARLVREAQAMATLSHPNVVAVFDAGIVDGQVFLAMEYVEGVTLGQWLATAQPDWRAIVEHFLAAARGLAAAHGAGILHRDFKPHNVLVGNDGRVRVTDFGLARPLHAPLALAPGASGFSPPELTINGAVVGTPAYMAPEQLHGQEVDARSDIFSFCVALYEALFGVRPYDATSIDGLRWQMMQGQIRRAPNRLGVPSSLVRVLESGLRVHPGERPQSVVELIAKLESSAGGDDHVRVHRICQGIFAVFHAIVATWFTYDVFIKPSDPSSLEVDGSNPEFGFGMWIAAVFFLIWALAALVFLYGGTFWAVLNAIGLARRRRWARRSTLVYGVFALTSLIGIPYGIYAIWSLTREQTKRSLTR